MTYLLLAVSLLFILGFNLTFQKKAEKAELENFRAEANKERQNKELALSLFAAI